MRRVMRILPLVAALAAVPASAHEKGDRAMGVVESVSAARIVIRAADGHEIAFTVTGDTRFVRGDAPVGVEDVEAGQRAVVRGRRVGEELRAVHVKLAPPVKRK